MPKRRGIKYEQSLMWKPASSEKSITKRHVFLYILGGLVSLIVIIVGLSGNADDETEVSYSHVCNGTHNNNLKTFKSSIVSSDAYPCASIASNILKRGGTVADAAVAGILCVGVMNSQSMGLGGGFFATFYNKSEGKAYCLDAREVAPAAASKDMYMNTPKKGKWWEERSSFRGGLAVAVPGESAGLYELYKRFGGKIQWQDLLEPIIKLCEDGYKVNWGTAKSLVATEEDIRAEPSMRAIFIDKNGNLLREGDIIKRPILARTLRALQKNPYELVNGTLAKELAKDIQAFDGIVTEEDLANYKAKWREPIKVDLQSKNFTLLSFPPPGSGLIVGLVLNILDTFNLTPDDLDGDDSTLRTYQRITEAFKFAFARRSMLGDIGDEDAKNVAKVLTDDMLADSISKKIVSSKTYQDFSYYGSDVTIKEDRGTAHFSIVGPNGDAIAVTGSINYYFGSGIFSNKTGIFLNNEMDDFVTNVKSDASINSNNLIVPGHRPLSSMSPSIVVDPTGAARLVIGAAGGLRIATGIAWVAARAIWLENIKTATDSCRLHHQMRPMQLQYEEGFPENLKLGLKKMGHKMVKMKASSVVTPIWRNQEGDLQGVYDFRRGGQVEGF